MEATIFLESRVCCPLYRFFFYVHLALFDMVHTTASIYYLFILAALASMLHMGFLEGESRSAT